MVGISLLIQCKTEAGRWMDYASRGFIAYFIASSLLCDVVGSATISKYLFGWYFWCHACGIIELHLLVRSGAIRRCHTRRGTKLAARRRHRKKKKPFVPFTSAQGGSTRRKSSLQPQLRRRDLGSAGCLVLV